MLRSKSAVKDALNSGALTFAQVLDAEVVRDIQVRTVITWVPGWGKQIAESLMREAHIHPSKKVRELSKVQKAALIERVGR